MSDKRLDLCGPPVANQICGLHVSELSSRVNDAMLVNP